MNNGFRTGAHPPHLHKKLNTFNILKQKKIPTNNEIRSREVRVVSDDGEHVGVLQIEEAIKMAKEKGLDLVQMTGNVIPPVCKITDFGKYAYAENKKKGKSSKPQMKSVRLGFSISDHDMEIRVRSAEKFLKGGNSVRVVLPLRGREKALGEVGKEKMNKFIEMVKEKVDINVEGQISREPRGLTVTISKK